MIKTKEIDKDTITKQNWVKKILRVDVDNDTKYIIKCADPHNHYCRLYYIDHYCVIVDSLEEAKNITKYKRQPGKKHRHYKAVNSLLSEIGMKYDHENFFKYVKLPNLKSKQSEPTATLTPIGKPLAAKSFIIKAKEWQELRHKGKVSKNKVMTLSDPNTEVSIIVSTPTTKPVAVYNNTDHLVITAPIKIGTDDYYVVTLINMKTKDYVEFAAENASV